MFCRVDFFYNIFSLALHSLHFNYLSFYWVKKEEMRQLAWDRWSIIKYSNLKKVLSWSNISYSCLCTCIYTIYQHFQNSSCLIPHHHKPTNTIHLVHWTIYIWRIINPNQLKKNVHLWNLILSRSPDSTRLQIRLRQTPLQILRRLRVGFRLHTERAVVSSGPKESVSRLSRQYLHRARLGRQAPETKVSFVSSLVQCRYSDSDFVYGRYYLFFYNYLVFLVNVYGYLFICLNCAGLLVLSEEIVKGWSLGIVFLEMAVFVLVTRFVW